MEYLRCYAQVSLPAIGHNIDEVRKRLAPGVKLLAVIKADAYGHGACRVGKYLEPRVNYFAVATLEEAVELREGGITRPILILSYVSPSQYPELVRYEITQTIDSLDQAEALEQAAAQAGKRAKIHIGVDTGMTRIGFQVREDEAGPYRADRRISSSGDGRYLYSFFLCRPGGQVVLPDAAGQV